MSRKIIFITGTDTGVGKTLLTAHLLHHLRLAGVRALAVKPFCSGGRADVRLLQSLQPGELSDQEMNPWYFAKPVAPLVATQKNRQNISLNDVVRHMRRIARKCDCLLVEGSGGLLVPLGRGYAVADLIVRLNCQVIVAARNRLGTINHTLLTIKHLQSVQLPAKRLAVVLIANSKPDPSSPDNPRILTSLLKPVKVLQIPDLGPRASNRIAINKNHKKIRPVLEKLTVCVR